MDFEWNIFPGSTTLQLADKVQDFLKIPETTYLHLYVQYDIKKGTTDNVHECMANAILVSLFAQRFPATRWSFLEPGSEKKCYSTYIDRPRREWDRVAEWMMIKFGESGHPVFRATSPLSEERSKAKEADNHRYTSVPMGILLKLFVAPLFLLVSSVFTEQFQISVMNARLVKQERRDPCWQDNLTHCSSQQTL